MSENPQFTNLLGKSVYLQFFFKNLGLSFESTLRKKSDQFFFEIPDEILKINQQKNQKSSEFYITLFYGNTKLDCPVVKNYMQTEESAPLDSIANRFHAPKIIDLGRKGLVFSTKKNDMIFKPDFEYDAIFHFPIKGPIKERRVALKLKTDSIFETENDEVRVSAIFCSIKEEDERFLNDFFKIF